LRKKSILQLILGGAAVHRCDNCFVLNTALAAGGSPVNDLRSTITGQQSPVKVLR